MRKGAFKVSAVVLFGTALSAIPMVQAKTVTNDSSTISHAPRIVSHLAPNKGKSVSNLGWQSTNWSGYAVTGQTYNSITGTWVVSAVSSSKRASYSSTWIGIDGYNNSNLIQTGTEADYYNHSAHYDAWWEILPDAETVIPNFTVQPGDEMYADIENLGNNLWSITIKDLTRNESFTTKQTYTGPQTSAEWIEEAPTVGGRVATLANYGETYLNPDTVNGVSPNLVASDGGAMVDSRGNQISTPSVPNAAADGFNVAYGASAPAAPTN